MNESWWIDNSASLLFPGTVSVIVLDVNDNCPQFAVKESTVTIKECDNFGPDTNLLTLYAEDRVSQGRREGRPVVILRLVVTASLSGSFLPNRNKHGTRRADGRTDGQTDGWTWLTTLKKIAHILLQ